MAGQLVCIAALTFIIYNKQTGMDRRHGNTPDQMIASPLSPPYHVQLWSLVNAMDFRYRILAQNEI